MSDAADATPIPGLVRAYADLVAEAVAQTLGDRMVSVAFTGSLALGDFDDRCSDIDLIAVSRDPLGHAARRDLPARLDDQVLPCPATGLDLIVFCRQQVTTLPRPLRFELAVTTGARWGLDVVQGTQDEEMLLDLEIARRHGTALRGAAPQACLTEVPAPRLRGALRDALSWQRHHLFHPHHDPRGDQGVLAACRALHWLETGELVSKSLAGGRQARAPGHGVLVGEALARRAGRQRTALRGADCRALLDLALHRLENP